MFNTKVSQATIAHEFRVENKKLHMAICRRKYDPGKKVSHKKNATVKQKATEKKPTADQPTTPEVEIAKICSDNDEQTQQDTNDEQLYGSDNSLPNPFTLQDPKKFRTTDTKEDQGKEKADASTTAMEWRCQNSSPMTMKLHHHRGISPSKNHHCENQLVNKFRLPNLYFRLQNLSLFIFIFTQQ